MLADGRGGKVGVRRNRNTPLHFEIHAVVPGDSCRIPGPLRDQFAARLLGNSALHKFNAHLAQGTSHGNVGIKKDVP